MKVDEMRIAVIIGSLRKESYNRKVCETLAGLAPPGVTMEFIDIEILAHFNPDNESMPSREYTAFRRQLGACDGFLFATPEYNHSMPGVLKNALDIGSQPDGESVWAGKPAAAISASSRGGGGFGAHKHLHQSLVYLDMRCMTEPELYIPNVDELYSGKQLADGQTRQYLQRFMTQFCAWVDRAHSRT
jgi:chromate reductase